MLVTHPTGSELELEPELEPEYVESLSVNQLKTLPVRLRS